MKRIILLIVFPLLVGQQQLFAQSCYQRSTAAQVILMENLKGNWQGHIESGIFQQPLSFSISDQNNQIIATIMDGSSNHPVIKAQAGFCSPGKYHFFGNLPTGEEFSYNAFLKNGSLEGNFSPGRTCSKDAKRAFFLKRSASTKS